jgi:hypothetical protein
MDGTAMSKFLRSKQSEGTTNLLDENGRSGRRDVVNEPASRMLSVVGLQIKRDVGEDAHAGVLNGQLVGKILVLDERRLKEGVEPRVLRVDGETLEAL